MVKGLKAKSEENLNRKVDYGSTLTGFEIRTLMYKNVKYAIKRYIYLIF